jgi:hypothetical protein
MPVCDEEGIEERSGFAAADREAVADTVVGGLVGPFQRMVDHGRLQFDRLVFRDNSWAAPVFWREWGWDEMEWARGSGARS